MLFLSSCQLFSGGSKPDRNSPTDCAAPKNPTLLGTSPELRNEVSAAAKSGLVVVRYFVDGCAAALTVQTACSLPGRYDYATAASQRSVVLEDERALAAALPLHAGGLDRALDEYGALRIDEELVGRLDAAGARPTRASLTGDGCADATHVAVAIEVGGASLVAGPTTTVSGPRNWFMKPSRSKTNPAPLQYLGRVSTCRRAREKKERTLGCDHPLRLILLPLAGEEPEQPEVPAPEMISVPAGKFRMGKKSARRGDGPLHHVALDAFEIDRTEVTAADYRTCVEAGACTPPATGRFCTGADPSLGRHPINCVTWKQAAAYCRHVKKRLPTEAEWERAARGTDARRFVWGKSWPPPSGAGNVADEALRAVEPEFRSIEGYDDGHAHTAPVGVASSPSPGGAVDMAGNVMEWVQDWYHDRAYRQPHRKNPRGPPHGVARVARGGSFGHAGPGALEVTRRYFYLDGFESAHIGFRCARSVEPQSDPDASR